PPGPCIHWHTDHPVNGDGTKTATARPTKPDTRVTQQGGPRSRVEPPCRDELCCTFYRARIHHAVPDHGATRLCSSGDRLCSGEVPRRIEIAEALPQQLPQPWRFSRRLHRYNRQEAVRTAATQMAPHRRLLVSARRNADRRILAGWKAAEWRVGARPGCRPL